MNDPITASELHEIVRPLPREEWPDRIEYDGSKKSYQSWVWNHSPTFATGLDPESARLIFVGHLAEKLVARTGDPASPTLMEEVKMTVEYEGEPISVAVDGGGCNWYHGPTLLHALVAYFTGRRAD